MIRILQGADAHAHFVDSSLEATALGEYDDLFIALLKECCRHDSVDLVRVPDYFRAHANRGVILLQTCVRSLGDIAILLPRIDLPVTAESADEA